jgi:hypothetical protein
MTSKIKVDNINKVSDDSNIIKKCGVTTTVGSGSGQTIVVDGDTVTLGRCSGTVALASGATQTGFGRTGTVDWQTTPKTGDFTAVNGEGYFVNTTSGAVVMTMPSGSAGAIVSIQDYNKTFDSNSLTVTPASGEKINGGSASGSLIIGTEGQGLTFVYVDGTVGWKTVYENDFTSGGSVELTATGGTITTSGNCKIHTFTGPGNFCVSQLSSTPANNQVSYMVVAGGGGGGGNYGGGGGAGGFREDKSPTTPYTASPLEGAGTITATVTNFPITVGAGGTGAAGTCDGGAQGSSSIFSSITSAGGGGGGGNPSPAGVTTGGSGGGGGSYSPVPYGFGPGSQNAGAAGNTPPVSPSQGNTGGFGLKAPNGTGGGGGGGATATGTGSAGPSPVPGYSGSDGGNGGAGATTSINATPTAFAGGGGGATEAPSGGKGAGGSGGGGDGRYSPGPGGITAENGTANTGGGGGGGWSPSIGSGGSGIVIIRYKFQ